MFLYLRTMNKQRKPKHTVYFARQWLEDVFIHCRSLKGFLLHLRTHGHLNPRYTSLHDETMLDIEKFLRIEVNLSMVEDKDDFLNHWMKIGIKIYEFGNEHGDEFNKLFMSKKAK